MSATQSQDWPDEAIVTVLLVCWNHRRFVRTAIVSVFEQTYTRLQVVVFDNGSTDGSQEELKALKAQYDFELILQDNVGLVRALNRGLSLARGKYIAPLSTDDRWLPHKIALQVAYMEQNPDVHLVAGQIESIDADGGPGPFPTIIRAGEPTFAELMNHGNYVPGPTVMCRLSTLQALGGYDESIRIEDYSLVLKLTYRKMRVVVLPEIVTQYRFHGSNWTAGSLDDEFHELGMVYRHTPEYRGFYRHYFPLTFWRLVKEGQKRKAIALLFTEPVPWTWANVGKGMLRLLIPYSLVRLSRTLQGKPAQGD